MRFLGVVPARFNAHRLPGKPLIEVAGRPLVQWVCERVASARFLNRVVVATDDCRIYDAVQGFGGEAILTREDHTSGTDRVAEVAARLVADVYVNVQADEPLLESGTIDAICQPFLADSEIQITTARSQIKDAREVDSPDHVKVVADRQGKALYFSRIAIPHSSKAPAVYYRHLGIYAYRRRFLLGLSRLEPSDLEKTEGLEQLRFMDNGIPIQVVTVQDDSFGVDTQKDLDRVRPLLENRSPTDTQVAVKERVGDGD